MFDETKGPDTSNREVTPQTSLPEETSTDAYTSSSDPYGQPSVETIPPALEATAPTEVVAPPPSTSIVKPPPPPPPPPPEDEEDEEEEGMLRMSFMEHLEELRARILKALGGIIVAFLVSITFCKVLWSVIEAPAVSALTNLGINPPDLAQITPMETFNVIYLKLPLLCSIFLSSPWILYQVWAFISPGLYKREKKWAVPFILSTAGLFIAGGLFAYFVAFRFGLEFLLGIGMDVHVKPVVSINYYFDLFMNVTLGVGLVFELPVLIFFLTLLRIVSPRFLFRNSRYAILAITILAAIVTPTPDVFNMMIFAVPMVMLYFVGLFAAYLLVLRREERKLPWARALIFIAALLAGAGAALAILIFRYHYHFINHWPFLVK
jgi:sec-independent protein translocase protein TatC